MIKMHSKTYHSPESFTCFPPPRIGCIRAENQQQRDNKACQHKRFEIGNAHEYRPAVPELQYFVIQPSKFLYLLMMRVDHNINA
jgi:hypothetical protein